jgi:predicted transcriptional regulator
MIEKVPLSSRRNAVEAKEAVRALLDRLPDDCSIDDVLYHLYVLRAIERGQADVAVGRTLSHEQVEEELRSRWLLGTGE